MSKYLLKFYLQYCRFIEKIIISDEMDKTFLCQYHKFNYNKFLIFLSKYYGVQYIYETLEYERQNCN